MSILPTPEQNPSPLAYFSFYCGIIGNFATGCLRFSYLLLFFTKVIQLTSDQAATLLTIAQLSDGISTPMVGYFSDYFNKGFGTFGKRKSWHLVGTVINIITPLLLFRKPLIGTQDPENPAIMWYYMPWVILFPISYAMIQVNHFALIPELSGVEKVRNTLSSFGYMGLLTGFIYTYVIACFMLSDEITISSLNPGIADETCKKMFTESENFNTTETSVKAITPEDLPVFQNLVIIIVLSSAVVSALFHFGVKEKPMRSSQNISRSHEAMDAEIKVMKKMMLWFKNVNYYMVFVIYVIAQLLLGVPIIYTPMYLAEKHTWISKTWMVYLQLIFFISGIPFTMLVKLLGNKYGMQVPYFLGCILIAAGSLLIGLVDCNLWLVIVIFALFGAGANGLTCSAMALVAQLIGVNTETGAFVFASMALGDKLSLAFLIKIIGNFEDPFDKGTYYENIMSTGLLCLVSIGVIAITVNWFSCNCVKTQKYNDISEEIDEEMERRKFLISVDSATRRQSNVLTSMNDITAYRRDSLCVGKMYDVSNF